MLPGKVVSVSCDQILVRPILYPLPRRPGATEDRPLHVRQSQPRSRLVPSAHRAVDEVGSAGRGGFTESLLGNRMRLKLPPELSSQEKCHGLSRRIPHVRLPHCLPRGISGLVDLSRSPRNAD